MGGHADAVVIGRRMVIATAVILVVVAVTAAAWFSRHGAPTPPAPTRTPEEKALTTLQQRHVASLSRLVLDGRWVAQVASKSIGIVDPLQVAANGTHTFYAADILAEIDAVTRTVSDPSSVLVLQSGDFGKRSFAADRQPYWITVVDAGFSGSDSVRSWCAQTFSSLSGEQLDDACVPRTLSPPHD
jgi:hypothetical protein